MEKKDLEARVEGLEKENRILDSRILELYTLYSISKRLSMTTHLEEIFSETMEHISRSLKIDDFCIMLLDKSNEFLTVSASHSDTDLKNISLSVGEGISGRVPLLGEKVLIQDVSKEPDFLFYKGKKRNIGSFLTIPLKRSDKSIIGTLNVHKPEANAFLEKDVQLFDEVAQQIAVAIDKALSFRNIRELSMRDDLTGLYNRRYFFDTFEKEMERARRFNRNISVIILDIDHFKNFNDKNGHLLGDDALRTVAATLEENVRKADTLARYGGEEFIVLISEQDKTHTVKIAEKLRVAIEEIEVSGEKNQPRGKLTVTLGVSSYPDDTQYATELIDCADKALYSGKTKGRNIVVAFMPD
ncbi:MAG: sensor domain-containing diguanylate cyclase [Deltaproteobacteria bacterium]|nr:sensor domain-containing diguanylate cyclase [Deltaproteobacteria bacterium]